MFRLPALLSRLPSLLRTVAPSARRPIPSTSLVSSLPFSRSFSSSPVCELTRKPTKIKLKTHKGAAKRFKALANGEFKRAKVGRVHLNSSGAMSPARLNRLGQTAYATQAEKRTLRRLLPYSV
ncbi:hypothetical protein JCM8547_005149 [Rhodosporidiobolus lusitaniae]